MRHTWTLLAGAMLTMSVAVAAAQTSGACNRECLIGLTEAYLSAMVAREPAKAPVTANVRFTQNSTADGARAGRVGIHQGRARLQAVRHRPRRRTGRTLHGGGRRRTSRPPHTAHEGGRAAHQRDRVGLCRHRPDRLWQCGQPGHGRSGLDRDTSFRAASSSRGDGGHRQPLLRNPREEHRRPRAVHE